jgi:hypothetical protein
VSGSDVRRPIQLTEKLSNWPPEMAVSILSALFLSQRKLQHYHVKSKDEFQSELELPRGPGRGNLPGRIAIGVTGAVAPENTDIAVSFLAALLRRCS